MTWLPWTSTRSSARRARLGLAALIAAALLLSLPASGFANDVAADRDAQAERGESSVTALVSAGLLGRGAGYASPNGSEAVRELQARLRRLGHRPGPSDGLFGPLTEAAVRRFQQAQGLAVDGVAGPHTVNRLMIRPRQAPAGRVEAPAERRPAAPAQPEPSGRPQPSAHPKPTAEPQPPAQSEPAAEPRAAGSPGRPAERDSRPGFAPGPAVLLGALGAALLLAALWGLSGRPGRAPAEGASPAPAAGASQAPAEGASQAPAERRAGAAAEHQARATAEPETRAPAEPRVGARVTERVAGPGSAREGGLNLGLACAALLMVFAAGAASGAIFATRAGPSTTRQLAVGGLNAQAVAPIGAGGAAPVEQAQRERKRSRGGAETRSRAQAPSRAPAPDLATAAVPPAGPGDAGAAPGPAGAAGVPAQPAPATPPAPARPPVAAAAAQAARPSYTVRAGDSLWPIARGQLSPGASNAEVARRVARIEALNLDGRIASGDPDVIEAGEELRLR